MHVTPLGICFKWVESLALLYSQSVSCYQQEPYPRTGWGFLLPQPSRHAFGPSELLLAGISFSIKRCQEWVSASAFSWNVGRGCAVSPAGPGMWGRSCGSTACCRCWVWQDRPWEAAGVPQRCGLCRAVTGLRECSWRDRAGGGADCGLQRVTLLKLHRRRSPGTPQVISSECCLKRLSHGFTNVLWPEDVFLTSKGSSGWLSASQAESTIPLCSWCVLTMCDFFGMRCFLKAALTCVQMKLALKLVNTNWSCGQFSSEPDKWVVLLRLCVFVSS